MHATVTRGLGAAALLALAIAGAGQRFSGASAAAPDAVGAGAEWPGINADSNETGFSRLTGITAANVHRLGLAWTYELPGEASLEGAPIMVGGMLYFTGSYATVYALDARTGKRVWSYAPETWKNYPSKMNFNFAANRGVAYAGGRIFSAALDGRLFALDARTGKLVWSVETTDPHNGQTITGAPRVFAGPDGIKAVIVGQGGADFGMRGYVTAYDQETGKQLWRSYMVPGSPEQNAGHPALEAAAKTWSPDFWKKTGGGGGPWDSITYDAALNRLYVGTANAAPYDPEMRSPGGGDNLYTASIVALDAGSGRILWHYQTNPRDSWDFDATQQMTLATLTIDGKRHRVLMQAPKNGFFYVIDRDTGKLLSAGKIGKENWADHIDLTTGRPVENPDIRYEHGMVRIYPSGAGAHDWMRMAWDPATGLVYIPYMQFATAFHRGAPDADDVDIMGLDIGNYKKEPGDATGALLAWDPVRQQARWRVPLRTMWNGGVLATAGGVVFQGRADGWLVAYDAVHGRQLWKGYAGMGIIGAPITYALGGRQYVAVLAGYGGTASMFGAALNVGWKYQDPRRLLVFALDAHAKLPPSPAPTLVVNALDNPDEKLDPKAAATGKAMFMACAACHGLNLVNAGGPGPDLRESPIPLDPDAFYALVHDGLRMDKGMPGFGIFGRPQIEAIRQYIRAVQRETAERNARH
ncbi:MAG: PQQ-dependent dehydrogenase, methanol/ethanol family [Sphingomonadales bacterium]|nr:PQQ-dependent dehydrogenase, methanol/ethanol family [Sphingomonadales bacterium]